jgi:Fe-S-cluster containining protein
MTETSACNRFSSDLINLENRTAELEALYDGLFKSIGYHLYDYVLDNDGAESTLPYLYAYTDHAVQDLRKSRLNTQPLACRKSCAYCCHLTVKCPAQIVFHIAAHLRQTWANTEIDDLIQRLDLYTTAREQGTLPPCPFLNAEAACTIYDIRPISCRAFTSADVRLCQGLVSERGNANATVPQHSLIYRVYEMATTALQGAALKQGRDKEQVLFQPALAAVLRHPELETEWKAGKPIDALFQ